MQDTEQQLGLSDFESLVGEVFVFSPPGVADQQVEGELAKAEPIRSGMSPAASREPFVLEFRFPADANIGQCVLEARTAGGRRFPPMLLVPRGNDGAWVMDTIFN